MPEDNRWTVILLAGAHLSVKHPGRRPVPKWQPYPDGPGTALLLLSPARGTGRARKTKAKSAPTPTEGPWGQGPVATGPEAAGWPGGAQGRQGRRPKA